MKQESYMFQAHSSEEVSALVVDFGSYTTRAGYAGEDCPRVVCPSFYGYTDEPAGEGSTATSGGGSNGNGEDVPMDGVEAVNGEKKGKGRKYYVGDDGVGVWRAGVEVDNFMQDGIGTFSIPATVRM